MGAWIRQRMDERGLTGKALAEMVGISRTALSQIVNEKSQPRPQTFNALISTLARSPLEKKVITDSYLFAEHIRADSEYIGGPKNAVKLDPGIHFKLHIIDQLTTLGYRIRPKRHSGDFDVVLDTTPTICLNSRYLRFRWPSILGETLVAKELLPLAGREPTTVLIVVPFIDQRFYAVERDTELFFKNKIYVTTPSTMHDAIKAIVAGKWGLLRKQVTRSGERTYGRFPKSTNPRQSPEKRADLQLGPVRK